MKSRWMFKVRYNPDVIEDIHNFWLYSFTNPLDLGIRVSLSLSHRQPYVVYIFNYKMFHQEASVETIKRSNPMYLGEL